MSSRNRRGITPGSVTAIALSALVVLGFMLTVIPFWGHAAPRQRTAAVSVTAVPRQVQRSAVAVTASPPPVLPSDRSFTLTAGGTVALEESVRTSGYYSDTKKYNFDEIFSLLKPDLAADIRLVSLENLVVPGAKVSKLVAPEAVMAMLARGGFGTVSLGFKRAWEQGTAGITGTLDAVQAAGMRAIGAFDREENALPAAQIQTVNGVKVALMHFTASPSSTSRNKLKKDGRTALFPLTDAAPAAIAEARAAGAEAVIVSVHWGNEGNSAPTGAQKKLAQQLADAGADVILGVGARRVQKAEWLSGMRPDGSVRQTLCCWCLGCLLADSRDNGAVAGMLVHLTVRVDSAGNVFVEQPSYTPTFIWRYTFNGVSNYRVVSTVRDAPDGMTTDQANAFRNARSRIEKKLTGTPLTERVP